MCICKKKIVIVVEPHPDDVLGSASGICFATNVETIVLTITNTDYKKKDYRDKIQLDKVNLTNKFLQKLNVKKHIHAGFDDMHWDKRIQGPVNSHEQLIAIYKENYGINNYQRLCFELERYFKEMKSKNDMENLYIALPLGVMHPMHVLTTSACLDAIVSCNINSKQIIFYVDHPYDVFDIYTNQSELAKEYILTRLGMNLIRVDDVSVDTAQAGEMVKELYNDKHYGEFNGTFNKVMCSYLIDSTQFKVIQKFLKIRQNNILFVATEAVPIYKTGGLGEVVYQLTKVLSKNVNNICIVLPKTGEIALCSELIQMDKKCFIYKYADGKKENMILEKYMYKGLIYYVVDVGYHEEEGEMYSVFCDVILQQVINMIEFTPNIIHCNDWQTGLVPLLHKIKYSEIAQYNNLRTIYTIHASCYKGVLPKDKIIELMGINRDTCKLCMCCTNSCKLQQIDFLTEKQAEILNIQTTLLSMQRIGVNFADAVTTVSEGHAKELQKLPEFSSVLIKGIRNGIYNQRYEFLDSSEFINIDELLMQSYDSVLADRQVQVIEQYKKHNKLALQNVCGLPQDKDKLFICMVSRLADVKGFDYLRNIFDELVKLPIQILIVGDEDPYNPMYKDYLERKAMEYPTVFVYKEFEKQLEFEAYAGSDIIFMPSIKESCGISQMKAMIYGTVPVVSNLGCFSDTIVQYGRPHEKDKGIGFYSLPDSWAFLEVIKNVIKLYHHNKDEWFKIVTSCFQTDFGWTNGVLKKYLELYNSLW